MSSKVANSVDKFKAAMLKNGVTPPDEIIADGEWHSYIIEATASSSFDTGWYIFSDDDPAAGLYGCVEGNRKRHWPSKASQEKNPEIKPVYDEKLEAMKIQRDKEFKALAEDSSLASAKQAVKISDEIDEEAAKRLSELSLFDYDRIRHAEARLLNVRVSTLDKKVTEARKKDEPSGTQLLSDIFNIFNATDVDWISTENIIIALCADEEKPWATYFKGKEIDSIQIQLGKMLSRYGIQSQNHRFGNNILKSYERKSIFEAYSRYVSTPIK